MPRDLSVSYCEFNIFDILVLTPAWFYLNDVKMISGKSNTTVKGQEPMLYEALYVIAGRFFKFTYVKMLRIK